MSGGLGRLRRGALRRRRGRGGRVVRGWVRRRPGRLGLRHHCSADDQRRATRFSGDSQLFGVAEDGLGCGQ